MTTQCDVAVLGAGLAGLCAARDLIGAGLNAAARLLAYRHRGELRPAQG